MKFFRDKFKNQMTFLSLHDLFISSLNYFIYILLLLLLIKKEYYSFIIIVLFIIFYLLTYLLTLIKDKAVNKSMVGVFRVKV